MELKNLMDFIEIEDARLIKIFNYADMEKRILARTVKIAEETGELCSEVLAFNKIQRKEKLENHSKQKLAEEFADVLLTTLLLAKTMNIDVERALEEKIVKVNARYKNL